MTGTTVGGWVLGAEVGRGPTGVVYHATAVDEPTRVAAVKVLHHPASRTPDFLARFPAEMLALQRLNHPNVARFYDSGVTNGQAFYACELVDGQDLLALLKARKAADAPGLNWRDEVILIAAQMARGLKHGHHRSLLHRALKPTNVIVTADGTAKLTDFAVAKLLALNPAELPADATGTAGYLAPEHFTGKPLTRRSDLYALGGVIYHAVTGRPPFHATTTAEFLHKHCYTLPDRPANFVPKLPPDFDDFICGLLAKDPARRPASAAMAVELLDAVRGKAERKGEKVAWPTDPGDTNLTMPALPDDAGVDDGDDRPRPLMARPLVVVPLFLAVVAAILVGVFWPRPSADELLAAAQPLLASPDPAAWDEAWDKYLGPLAEQYPDAHPEAVKAAREKIADRREQRRAFADARAQRATADAAKLYYRGLRLAQANDPAAKPTWEALTRAFAGSGADARWVSLAQAGLDELAKATPSSPPSRDGLEAAIERAKAASDPAAAFADLLFLYRDDPAAVTAITAARK